MPISIDQPTPVSTDEFRRLLHLLTLLHKGEQQKNKNGDPIPLKRYEDYQINEALSRLPPDRRGANLKAGSSFGRWITDIDAHLKASAVKAKRKSIDQEYWLRTFLQNLEECFLKPNETDVAEQAVLKGPWTVTRTLAVHFWYWDTTGWDGRDDRKLAGQSVEGTLTIYQDWVDARLEYTRPEDDRPISWTGPVTVREDGKYRTHYLALTEVLGRNDQTQPNQLLLVVRTRPQHTTFIGTFSGTLGRNPIIGRALLVDFSLPTDVSTSERVERNLLREDLAPFARMFVAYQTSFDLTSSFAAATELPGFQLWQTEKKLFMKPLEGYFLRTDESRLAHFTLAVDTTSAGNDLAPVTLTYDDPKQADAEKGRALRVDKGRLLIEQKTENDTTVFRGQFEYQPDLQKFLYEVLFVKSKTPGSEWYIGVILGLNQARRQLLTGRFALHPRSLGEDALKAEKLGEVLQAERALADFLLEVDQQIPSETVPLYQALGWPHLPRVNIGHGWQFNTDLAGDYISYALIRGPLSPGKSKADEGPYRIAAYPLQIMPDGQVVMKFANEFRTRDNPDGYPVQYLGRAFYQQGSFQLYLYFSQRAGQSVTPLHLAMYFKISAYNKITQAFGTSNRFIEKVPESRMEVLVNMDEGSMYAGTPYREYDPFTRRELGDTTGKQLPADLVSYLAGRINRLILPSHKLDPNNSLPSPPRQDAFRWLHIRAALFEMIRTPANPEECVNLLKDSYLHGFGTVSGDVENYLKTELKTPAIQHAVGQWAASDRTKLTEELVKLWKLTVTFGPTLNA